MKVYISSAYQDLVEYRAGSTRRCVIYGSRRIGMDQYIAEGDKPVKRCKADVGVADVLCDHRRMAFRLCARTHCFATGRGRAHDCGNFRNAHFPQLGLFYEVGSDIVRAP